MSTAQDYYAELGVDRNATADQIKAAYRRLARKYHPDVSKESDAPEKIKAINEAYSVLGDPQKKRAYDLGGSIGGTGGFSQDFDFGAEGSFADLFEHLFGFRSGRGPQRPQLNISVHDAYRGGSFQVQTNGKTSTINIPPGIRDGDILRQGDAEYIIRYRNDPRFQVENGSVFSVLAIEPWLVALGGEVEVQTLGGKIKASLPAGLEQGHRIRLAGRGMPALQGRPAGDHYCIIQWKSAQPATPEQKQAWQALANAYQAKPGT